MIARSSALLMASAALGIIADILLRAEPWGINVPVGLFSFAAALVWLHGRSQYRLARGWQYTLTAGLAVATLLAWRSSGMLHATNILFFLLALLTTVARPASGSLHTAAPFDLACAAVSYGIHALFGPIFLLAGELRRTTPPPGEPRFRLRVAKGTVLALPPLIVFCILFMAADPVFNHGVHAILDFDFEIVVSHLFLAGFIAWLLAGSLRGRFLAEPVAFPLKSIPQSLRLGVTEISIVFGSLIALFVVFLAIQFRYLFGGASLVDVVPDLTYAEYARSGFFELVTASAIVLPLILVADWLLVPVARRDRTIFRILALILVLLVFVLMTSALQRMLLYQDEFGLTQLRFFATAFMAWLFLMFLVFLATVLRGRRELFLSAGFAVTFVFLLILNAANPGDVIARTNVARAAEGKRFDASYNAQLGDDAVPVLVENLSLLNDADRQALLKGLSRHKEYIDQADWRSWTLSRSVAREILATIPVPEVETKQP